MGCGGSCHEKPWAQYKGLKHATTGEVLEKKAFGNGCNNCWHVIIDGIAPRVLGSWNEAEAWLRAPECMANFQMWKARAEGERRNFIKSGVTIDTKVGMRYEATLEPILLHDLEQDHPGVNLRRVPGLHIQQITNHKKEMVEAVLVQSNVPDRVIMYATSEGKYTEHYLQPEHQLRKGQGSEYWRQISAENLRNRPRLDVLTREGLLALLGVRPPTAAQNLAPARAMGSGEGEDRLAIVPAPSIPHTWISGMADSPVHMPTDLVELDTEAPGDDGSKGGKRRASRGTKEGHPDGMPESKKPKRSGGATASTERPNRGPARAGAEETVGDGATCTVESILEGQFEYPKRKAQHKIMSLENTVKSGQATAVEKAQANAEICALKAATNLTPQELPKVSDEVLTPHLTTLITHLGEDRLPLQLRLGLCRRSALLCVETPADCVQAIWPFPVPPEQGPPPAFDPFRPRAWCLMEDDTRTALLEAAVKLLSEDCLASLMATRKVAEIQELARLLVSSGPVFPPGHPPQDLRSLSVAVAAMVQTTAIEPPQLSALLALKDGTRSIFKNMSPLLSDAYWTQQQANAWRFATHESTMTPAMARTREALLRPFPPGDALEESSWAVAARIAHWEPPWTTLEASLPKWKSMCRPGATAPVTQAAAAAATAAVSEIVATTARVTEDMAIMEIWRSRASWLTSELMSSGLALDSPELRQLTGASRAADDWLLKATAQVMLSRGAVTYDHG